MLDREPFIKDKNATESHIRRTLKRKGFSERRIVGYLRGWNLVKEGTNLKPRIKKETENVRPKPKSTKSRK